MKIILLDEEKLIPMRWSSSNREWYISHGYTYTKCGDIFFVKRKDLSVGSSVRVDVQCDYCGNLYNTQYALYYSGHKKYPKDCCAKCTGKKTSDVTYVKRRDKYWAILEEFCNKQKYTLETKKEEYTDIKMTIYYSCWKHGRTSNMMENMLHGFGCQKCGREHTGEKLLTDKDFVEEYINSINGNKLLNKHDYKGVEYMNLNIQCGCGDIFTTSFRNYKYGNVTTCKTCSHKESRGETIIRKILEENNICFEKEKRFFDCRDKKPLPFDFYIPSKNLIIEYDGEQHYFECNFNGVPSNLKTVQKHDKIKNEYCKNNNINLLRIPYWEKNNIEILILNCIHSLPQLKECV